MPKTVLFTFADKAEQEQFILSYNKLIKKSAASKSLALDVALLQKAATNITLDPELQIEGHRATAVFVSNKKVFEGTLKDCKTRFQYEIGSHSGGVEIREKRGDSWVTIRSRKFQ